MEGMTNIFFFSSIMQEYTHHTLLYLTDDDIVSKNIFCNVRKFQIAKAQERVN